MAGPKVRPHGLGGWDKNSAAPSSGLLRSPQASCDEKGPSPKQRPLMRRPLFGRDRELLIVIVIVGAILDVTLVIIVRIHAADDAGAVRLHSAGS